MLRIFYGPDTFSRGEALAALRRSLDGDGMLATNTALFDGKSVKPDELFAACDTVPFLAEHRLVLVDGLLGAQEGRVRRGRAGRARASAAEPAAGDGSPWAALPEYARRLPPTTELVLVEGELRADTWLLAALRDAAELRQFPLLGQEELQRWVQARAHAVQAPITARAAATLAEAVGANLWQLNSELEKLALYAHGRPIEVSDVTAMVHTAEGGTVFQLCDAVLAGRGGEALRLARLLLDGGAAGPYLLTMLARQYRQLLVARDLQRRGAPRAEIARRAEVPDFRVTNVINQAQRFPPGRLEAIYERLLEADLAVKRGDQDEDAAIELLVAELTMPRV
ncbi:MAG TPA: DNA polymerase III subunit delta [Dehalococcoidia bacterium]|nr:DNA polymerase III subunit delta [Dehalococcoidia bacterium]